MMKWTKMIDEEWEGLHRRVQRSKIFNVRLWCNFSYAATTTLLVWEDGGDIKDSEERAFVRRYQSKDYGSCYEVRWGGYNNKIRQKVLFNSGLKAAKAEAMRQYMTYNVNGEGGKEAMKIGTVALLKDKDTIEEVLVIDISLRHVLLFSETRGELGWVKKKLILDVVSEPDSPEVSDESHMDIFLDDRFLGEEVGTIPEVGEQVKWALEMDGAELTVTGYVLNVYADGQGIKRATCSEKGVCTYNKYWEVPLSRLL